LGHDPTMILAGRRINDSMGKLIAEKTVLQISLAQHSIVESKILILGLTFKENIPDLRNTKVLDIICELNKWECTVDVYDPIVDFNEAKKECPEVLELPPNGIYTAVIFAVQHDIFLDQGPSQFVKYLDLQKNKVVFVDVCSMFHNEDFPANVLYWSL